MADRVIPAGTYTFSFPGDSIGGTFIRSADPAQAIAVAVLGLLGSQADSEAGLASVIFNRYEDRHLRGAGGGEDRGCSPMKPVHPGGAGPR